MKHYFLFLCFIVLSFFLQAQQVVNKKEWSDSTLWKKSNTFFVEGGGYSLIAPNYDKIIYVKRSLKLSIRAGFSLFTANQHKGKQAFMYLFPVGLNAFWGRAKHHFQIGIGELYVNMYEYPNSNTSLETVNINIFDTFLFFGYRYQKPTGGLFIQAGWTLPILEIKNHKASTLGSLIIFIPEVGIGYSFLPKGFRKKK
ncbi:MAG: hypothetical protein HY841_02995 [Bacteroidetes bacterium]|nr:hypothetical protein [Bacteroidota bacterium]